MPIGEPTSTCPVTDGWSSHGTELAFPFRTPDSPLSLAPMYALLRREQPVCRVKLPTGVSAWLVTTWADARLVLSDPRLSKAALTAEDAPKARPGALPADLLFTTDPPQHTALRLLLTRSLNPTALPRCAPRMITHADYLIHHMAASPAPADLVSEFAMPLAMTSICELLGVPVADQAKIAAWAERCSRSTTGQRRRWNPLNASSSRTSDDSWL